jgi:hypothetical protein
MSTFGGGLFNPNAKDEKARIRRECERVKQLALDLIPEAVKAGLILNVSEVSSGIAL